MLPVDTKNKLFKSQLREIERENEIEIYMNYFSQIIIFNIRQNCIFNSIFYRKNAVIIIKVHKCGIYDQRFTDEF